MPTTPQGFDARIARETIILAKAATSCCSGCSPCGTLGTCFEAIQFVGHPSGALLREEM
jgi:hypothetical protein